MTGPALLDAVQRGDHERARALLQQGATPWATSHALLAAAIKREDPAMVELLLRAGANVNAPGPLDAPVLLDAAVAGDVAVGRLLLQHGARVDVLDPRTSTTPLLEAARFGNGPMVELLAQHGANLHAVDVDGHNAHTLARYNLHDPAAAVCARLGIAPQPQFDALVAETRAAIAQASGHNLT